MHVNFIHKNAKKEAAFSMAKFINRKKLTKEDISVIEKYFIYVVDDLVKYDKDSVLSSIIILKDKNIKLICYYFGFGSFYFISKYNGKTSSFVHLTDVAKVVIEITEEKANP